MDASCSASRAKALACAACGARQFQFCYPAAGHSIVRCERCGLGTALPRPSLTALRRLYEDPKYFADGDFYLDYLGHAESYQRLARRVVARVSRHKAPPGRWLDVGAAAGFFLKEAKAAGWVVSGIEPCKPMAAVARNAGLDVESALFEEVPLEKGSLSVVAFLDSLEHFLSPRDALLKAQLALERGGLVVVHTPNFRSLAARAMRQRWPHLTPPEHLHYFDAVSLRLILERAGYDVVSLSSLGHYFSLRELSRRLLHIDVGNGPLGKKTLYIDAGDLFAIARAR